jgi:hypothetical protein
LSGPAKCLLTRYPHASTALLPVAFPEEDIEAQCEADLITAPLTQPAGIGSPRPEPPSISIRVTSEPAGAKVFADDSTEPLGVTPYTYEAPSTVKQISLRLELDGYESADILFAGNQNGKAHLLLQKLSARPRHNGWRPKKSSSSDEFSYR